MTKHEIAQRAAYEIWDIPQMLPAKFVPIILSAIEEATREARKEWEKEQPCRWHALWS